VRAYVAIPLHTFSPPFCSLFDGVSLIGADFRKIGKKEKKKTRKAFV
jgi:hypothetical protein